MLPRRFLRAAPCLGVVFGCLLAVPARAADWPMWRYDGNRSAASPESLPADLHLMWTRDYPALKPAWPDQAKMQFDAAYEPIIAGKRLFIGSPWTDSVTAIDTETGNELWRFHADGPVRFAPVVWQGKVYFVSDDGFLYCLDAGKGTLIWKFRGGPADRRVLGNDRLVSTWPARGAPVIADGTVYFAASIWPFMGIFIHALDAKTGQVIWTNSGDGSIYMKQPHGTDSFASIAPQGPLVVIGDMLLIPGGRSVPAVYDRKTGKLIKYQLNENGKRGGGSEVAAVGKIFFNGNAVFELPSEKWLGDFGRPYVLTPNVAFLYQTGAMRAYDLKTAGNRTFETKDAKTGKVNKSTRWVMDELASCKVPPVEVAIKAGARLYAGAEKQVFAVEFPASLTPSTTPDKNQQAKQGKITWQATIDGTPLRLAAADGKLFAVTIEGRIYCFGGKKVEERNHFISLPPPAIDDAWTEKARNILETTKVRAGYCIVWGVGNGRLVRELARLSELHIIVVEPDEKKVAAFRKELVATGLYGRRVAIHAGHPTTFPMPPYLASLIVCEDYQAAGEEPGLAFLQKTFQALRPYGGVAWLPWQKGNGNEFQEQLRVKEFQRLANDAELANARVREGAGGVLLVREGALPGAANWTHEHADAANTRVSRDQIVKAPLGVLWFGGPSHDGILPRHGHGPQPQVIDGRLLIEGVDMLRCMDIYTGRVLWETRLPGLGQFYNNLAHQPGANASGTNFISTSDGIYIAYADSCVRLDPATGKKLSQFKLPQIPGADMSAPWGYISVVDDYLIGGADPWYDAKLFKPLMDLKASDDDANKTTDAKTDPVKAAADKLLATLSRGANDNMSASRHLVVMDRHTGEVLWRVAAGGGFRHNGVCVGNGRLYAIDTLSSMEISRLKKRNEPITFKPRLLVLDLKTGKELWKADVDVFGTWLSYSDKHDVLVESGRNARDTLNDEAKGMRAYRAGTGEVLWTNKSYLGPAILHGDIILKDQNACELLTGKPYLRTDPITGQPVEWKWVRNYGCNTPAASEHLMTFRSGAAGYFDLCGDSGTGNFGGFKSGCTNNLIVAGGVLTAPDYTRTCTCSYQNQTSIALVNMPEAEMWTSFGPSPVRDAIRRVGINFGAPGDRKSPDGTLWLEYPSVGGQSPVVPLRLVGSKLDWFRRHSSLVEGDMSWVGASGVKGLSSVTILRGPDPKMLYVCESLCQAFAPIPAGPAFFPTSLGQVGLSPYPKPKADFQPPQRNYTLRLHFVEPDGLTPGQRVFSVQIQGKEVLKDFDIAREAGTNHVLVKEFKGVTMTKELTVSFAPSKTATVKMPVLCGIELVAEGW